MFGQAPSATLIVYSCVACAAGGIVLFPDGAVVFVKWRYRVDLHAEDVFLDVVRQRLDLICRMCGRRHRKDRIQLLKRERLGFGDKEQDGNESDDVPPGIPSECTLRLECP